MSTTAQEILNKQNTYAGIKKWHDLNITGKNVVIWNAESPNTKHSESTIGRILESAPDATVITIGFNMVSDSTQIQSESVTYNGIKYTIEDFIRTFHIKIISRSVGSNLTNEGNASYNFWNNLKQKYNLIIFNSYGNDGLENKSCTDDISILIGACTLNPKGVPQKANYSNSGEEIDFMNFVGFQNGTSFSCPYTAGEAALLIERYGDLSSEEVYDYFKMCSEDMNDDGYDLNTGYGLIIMPDTSNRYITFTVDSNTYTVNGNDYTMDCSPVNNNGTTFVPVRALAEALGYTVNASYNADKTIKITINKANNSVILNTGSTVMIVNGVIKALTFVPYIDKNNRTLVPLRAITTAFGCKVDWIQNEKKVVILE